MTCCVCIICTTISHYLIYNYALLDLYLCMLSLSLEMAEMPTSICTCIDSFAPDSHVFDRKRRVVLVTSRFHPRDPSILRTPPHADLQSNIPSPCPPSTTNISSFSLFVLTILKGAFRHSIEHSFPPPQVAPISQIRQLWETNAHISR